MKSKNYTCFTVFFLLVGIHTFFHYRSSFLRSSYALLILLYILYGNWRTFLLWVCPFLVALKFIWICIRWWLSIINIWRLDCFLRSKWLKFVICCLQICFWIRSTKHLRLIELSFLSISFLNLLFFIVFFGLLQFVISILSYFVS